MLGYLVGSWSTAADRYFTMRAAVTNYGVFKGLKLGMRENLDDVNNTMQKITQAVDTLAKEHIALAGDAAEDKKKQWSEVEFVLLMTAKKVQDINSRYGLTPEETDEVQRLMIDAKGAEAENGHSQAAKDSAARDSGQKPIEAKPTGEPAKSAPVPDKPPEVKPVESKPAESANPASPPAATEKKP
jgi:hypothetical protein